MKSLYKDGICEKVKNISPYLTGKESIVVASRKTPISQLPKMVLGNMARDGGNLRIELCVQEILRVREKYSERTMAELYDPDKMPKDLLEAHHSLDLVIEACYRRKPFENDEQRLTHLFKMYEMMTSNASEEELKQLELGV